MAFTRKMLKAMGIEDEKVEQIMDAHVEVVDALKADRDAYKETADKYTDVEKELNDLKAKGGDWQTKYEKEHADFEAYKTAQTAKETETAKAEAYKALLTGAGVSEKRVAAILKVTDLSTVEMADGKIKNADELTKTIKTDWADFITSTQTSGAATATPASTVGGKKYSSKDEIFKISDPAERQQAIADNHELFGF